MKMKTSELTGPALRYCVAKCEGAAEGYSEWVVFLWRGRPCIRVGGHDIDYTPDTDWSQGGPIIEREDISLLRHHQPYADFVRWYATYDRPDAPERGEIGPTALIAAMRCFVASRLGDEVDVPEELRS